VSPENVDLVRRAFNAHRTGGIEAVMPFYAADVVFYFDPEWVEDAAYRGHDGIRRAEAVWAENFDDFAWAVQEIRDLEDRVLVLAAMTGRAKGSGVPVRQPTGLVGSGFRDGTIGEVRSFNSWQRALEAVGLRE
jgi:ketosteroid isomerase-like protein